MHDPPDIADRQLRQRFLGKAARLRHAFGVGIVGAHQQALGTANFFDDAFHVVLGIRHHVAVPAEDPARTLLELATRPVTIISHAAHLVHFFEKSRQPVCAVLGADDPDVREPLEKIVVDDIRERHLHGYLAVRTSIATRSGRCGVTATLFNETPGSTDA